MTRARPTRQEIEALLEKATTCPPLAFGVTLDELAALCRIALEGDEGRMGHARLDECADARETAGQPLYDRIGAKITKFLNLEELFVRFREVNAARTGSQVSPHYM